MDRKHVEIAESIQIYQLEELLKKTNFSSELHTMKIEQSLNSMEKNLQRLEIREILILMMR